jgi:alkylated DNA repair protein alkB family protein 8
MEEVPCAAALPVLRASRAETRWLFVANAGPKLGDTRDDLAAVFADFNFGDVVDVTVPDPDIAQCLVTMRSAECARVARDAAQKQRCIALGGRELWVTFAADPSAVGTSGRTGKRSKENGLFVPDSGHDRIAAALQKQTQEMCVAVTDSQDLGVKGATLLRNFITPEEELEILKYIDRPSVKWQTLAKRRVAHFGYAFDYGTRDANDEAACALPPWVETMMKRLVQANRREFSRALFIDQLTVNEYPAGVGLAPHVDTHSAFGPGIFSLSLAGNCVMEFRKLETGCLVVDLQGGVKKDQDVPQSSRDRIESRPSTGEGREESDEVLGTASPIVTSRAAIALPKRSMLCLTENARYQWQHYIPHRKRDVVVVGGVEGLEEDTRGSDSSEKKKSEIVERAPRRVSLTFRERRDVATCGPCQCVWPAGCDSRQGIAQRLKQRARPGLVGAVRTKNQESS